MVGCGPSANKPSEPAVEENTRKSPVIDEQKPDQESGLDEDCYATCLKQNQARAVAWDIVERDCTAACGGATVPGLPE